MRNTWDIFCQVVDNYGDIGTAWRLARQLVKEHDVTVRLWVDDLLAFQQLWPEIVAEADRQQCQGVEVRAWVQPFLPVAPAGCYRGVWLRLAATLFSCHEPAIASRSLDQSGVSECRALGQNAPCLALAAPSAAVDQIFLFSWV